MLRICFTFLAGALTLMYGTFPVGIADQIDHGLTGFSIESAFASTETAEDVFHDLYAGMEMAYEVMEDTYDTLLYRLNDAGT